MRFLASRLWPAQPATFVFFAGLALWLVVQGSVVAVPLTSRSLPPEVDDSYSYMVKAAQMHWCFWQDCPALNDLRTYAKAPVSDPQIRWQRYRVYGFDLLVYHPLYSALLAGIKQVGLEWETAFRLLWYAGTVFFGVVFAWWLRALWGSGPAGLAMGILAFQIFLGQGVHYVVPSNLCMGLGVLVWTWVIVRRGEVGWTLVVGTLALVLLHTVGRAYALMATLLVFLLAGFPRTLKGWWPVLAAWSIIGGYTLLPFFVERPLLRFEAYPFPPGVDTLTIVSLTLDAAGKAVLTWVNGVVTPGLVLGALLVGYGTTPPERRTNIIRTTLLLVSFLLLSLFYVIPPYPADLFIRMWIPVAVLLTGAVGQAVWFVLERSFIIPWKPAEAISETDTALFGGRSLSARSHVRLRLVVLMILVALAFDIVAHGQSTLAGTVAHMQDRQSIALEPEQPALLLAQSDPGDRVLYLDEIHRDFYLLHTGMQRGAVYYPALRGTAEEAAWMQRTDLRFAVIWDPVESLALERDILDSGVINRQGQIAASEVAWLRLEAPTPPEAETLRVRIHNSGRTGRVEVTPVDENGKLLRANRTGAEVAASWSGWVTLELDQSTRATSTRVWRIAFPEGESLFVDGLTFGETDHQWPWQQHARLVLVTQAGAQRCARTVSFDASRLVPPPLDAKPLHVLDDRGASVLVRVGP
jgi:hypothetical protein